MMNRDKKALYTDLESLFKLVCDTLTLRPESVRARAFQKRANAPYFFQGRIRHDLAETGSRQWTFAMDKVKDCLINAGIDLQCITGRYSVYWPENYLVLSRKTSPSIIDFSSTADVRRASRNNNMDGALTVLLPLEKTSVSKMENAVMHAVIIRADALISKRKGSAPKETPKTVAHLLLRLPEPLRGQAIERICERTGVELTPVL